MELEKSQLMVWNMNLKEGESILMPAKHPHAVYGKDQFKMLLTVVF